MTRRLEALYAMAEQDESPNERDIAIAKLEMMGAWPPPPKPPARSFAPAPEPRPQPRVVFYSATGNATANWSTFTIFASGTNNDW